MTAPEQASRPDGAPGPGRAGGFAELVERAAADRPDAPAVIDEQARWSWAELASTVSRLASALVGSGLRTGDRVAVQAPTSAQFVAVYLGALRAGLVLVPVNPAYTVPELDHILADSGARLLITASVAVIADADGLRQRHPGLDRIVVAARSGTDELATLTELLAGAEQSGSPAQPVQPLAEDGERLAVLLYTSGTSGRPKGAMLPVRSLLANLEQLSRLTPPPLTAEDRILLPLPLFHIFGLNAGLGMALYFGATLVLTGRFDAAESLRTIRDEQVSVVVGAPLEFAQWAGQPEVADAFAGVRYALSGSAPLSAELVAAYARFGVEAVRGVRPDRGGAGRGGEPGAGRVGQRLGRPEAGFGGAADSRGRGAAAGRRRRGGRGR